MTIAAMALTGCDEGRIFDAVPSESRGGLTASVEIHDACGSGRWFSGYTIAVAGFVAGSEYAVISENIELDDSGSARITLSGIPHTTNTIELCVIDRLRRRVAVFESIEVGGGAGLSLSSSGEDLSPEAAIQREVFNTTCINCHGGANFAAAGLNLTDGRSFGELVGCPSVKNPDCMRVAPGSPDESILYRILAGKESESWNYDHSVEITAQEKLELIKNWIKAQ